MISIPSNRFLCRALGAVGLILIVMTTSCERLDEYGRPVYFSSSPIYDGYKRIPLVYPFEICDWNVRVELRKWEDYNRARGVVTNSDELAHRILRFSQTNGYVFGECDKGWVYPSGALQWFTFSLTETNLHFIADKDEFARHIASFEGDIRQMRPFEEQWLTYWRAYERNKKRGK
jgi:hypothetical protein